MVDEVISIGAELESRSLIDWKILMYGDIPVLEAGPIDGVAHAVLKIECTCCGRREDRRTISVCCGEVFAGLPWITGEVFQNRRGPILYIELPLRATTEAANLSYAGVFVIGSNSAWLASLELSAATQSPVTE